MKTREVDIGIFRFSDRNHFARAYKEACITAAFSGKHTAIITEGDENWHIVYPDWSTVEIMSPDEGNHFYREEQ